jgi:hypothetical protein
MHGAVDTFAFNAIDGLANIYMLVITLTNIGFSTRFSPAKVVKALDRLG